MSNNIQLQIEHPTTHFLLYNNEKYPINFDVLKSCSKYFYERRQEIPENYDIELIKYDPDDNITSFSPNEVIEFIKYVQMEVIPLTKDNFVTLRYFGHKYDIQQLIKSTEGYINEHEEEVLINILKRKELLSNVELSFYEEKLSSNFSIYVNNEDIISLEVSTLYRILEQFSHQKDKEKNGSMMKDFLIKVLDKHGSRASILFKYADINTFDDKTLTLLLTKYSKIFQFEFISSSILNSFLRMKQERHEYEEETKEKYEHLERELQTQKKINEELSSTLEKERQERHEYEEETKEKFVHLEQELQTQKKINEEKSKQVLQIQTENEELLLKQETARKEQDEIKRELSELKQRVISMREENNDHQKDGFISVCKYNEHMMINNNMNKDKINQLVKYLIKEIDQQEHRTIGSEKEQEIIFLKKNDLTNKDNEENSTRKAEDIFISNDMIYIMYENGALMSQEFENELSQFPYIYFDIQYPTSTFERIYSEIIKLKRKLGNRIQLSIFYTGQENTDQRFHNNKEINKLVLGKTKKILKV